MKKILLLIAGCLFTSGAAFAQSDTETEDPTTNPGWWITVNITEPSGIPVAYYEMDPTEVTKSNNTVYSKDVTVDVYPDHNNPKPSKYTLTVTYTPEEGEAQTSTSPQAFQQLADGSITIAVAAWLNASGTLTTNFSNTTYVICDDNWTALAYLPASTTGQSVNQYFNLPTGKKLSAVRNLDPSKSTTQFLNGGNTQSQSNFYSGNPNVTAGQINMVTLDYNTASMTFEPVTSMELHIDTFIPFVAPIAVEVPAGVNVYNIVGYNDGVIETELAENNTEVAANTPVLLKADKSADYTFNFTGDYNNNTEVVSGHTIFDNVTVEAENVTVNGVLQPQYADIADYVFNGTDFVQVTSSKSTIFTTFTCYLTLSDSSVDTITVSFPDDEEENSEWSFTFSNENDNVSSEGTLNLYTEGTEAVFTVIAPADVDQVYYAYELSATPAPAALEDTELTYYEATKVDGSDENAFSVNLPLDGIEATGTLYIATKDTDADSYTNQGTYSVVITKSTSTGVENVDAATTENCVIYNVFGQKVDKSYKGIVICNGKKYIQR